MNDLIASSIYVVMMVDNSINASILQYTDKEGHYLSCIQTSFCQTLWTTMVDNTTDKYIISLINFLKFKGKVVNYILIFPSDLYRHFK